MWITTPSVSLASSEQCLHWHTTLDLQHVTRRVQLPWKLVLAPLEQVNWYSLISLWSLLNQLICLCAPPSAIERVMMEFLEFVNTSASGVNCWSPASKGSLPHPSVHIPYPVSNTPLEDLVHNAREVSYYEVENHAGLKVRIGSTHLLGAYCCFASFYKNPISYQTYLVYFRLPLVLTGCPSTQLIFVLSCLN